MLTTTDLAIVRAALMFLDEEFFPDQEEMFQHYLDDQGILAEAGTTDIPVTRAKLNDAELYSALKWVDRVELVSTNLTCSLSSEELSYQSDRELPVSVIITGKT